MGTVALIGLGSNVGDRKAHLDFAVTALAETPGVTVCAVSSYHETAPAGGPSGQGRFLNAAARLDTDLEPRALLRVLHDIEARAGRKRAIRWAERPLDLDLLIHGDTFGQRLELILPHPRMGVRRFVLAPLAEIAPEIKDPQTGFRIKDLLENLDRRPSFVAIDGPPGVLRDDVFDGVVSGLGALGLRESAIAPGPGPDWLEAEDARAANRLAPWYKARIRSLDADLLKTILDESVWLVTDFHFSRHPMDYPRARTHLVDRKPLRSSQECNDAEIIWESQRGRERGYLTRTMWKHLLWPTFIVTVPPNVRRAGWLSGRHTNTPSPVLVPGANDPDGMIHEILAACLASRA